LRSYDSKGEIILKLIAKKYSRVGNGFTFREIGRSDGLL
jgi:hypothetical protein